MLQGIWVYISELAGKDLDAVVVGKFLFYMIPKLIPMVLPLTILVASIMTFGKLSENYEFAAMKSSGISLQRAMRSLIFFISILSITTFFFANNVIPWSKYKLINLRSNIKQLKPALAIVEGSFNQVGDYNIKVEKKTGKNGQDLHNVIIHKKMKGNRGMIVIKSKTGKLKGDTDSDYLSLILYDGTLYQKLYSKNYRKRRRRPFVKNGFDEYKFNIDLSGFNDVDLDQDRYSNSASMLNISELRVALDSLSQRFNRDRKNFSKTLISRNGTEQLLAIGEQGESSAENTPDEVAKKDSLVKSEIQDSLAISEEEHEEDLTKEETEDAKDFDIDNIGDFMDSYKLRLRKQIVNLALTSSQGTLRTIQGKKENFRKKEERLNVTEIEIYDKYALAIMCYVLFFVGAPLGAIIRKGGIGMPMIIAIILFLIYYYIGMFAKNSAKDGSVSPFIATWLSTFIMLPLSVLVTYRATTDQGIFNADIILNPVRKVFAKIGLAKRKKKRDKS